MNTRFVALTAWLALVMAASPSSSWANDASVSFVAGSPRLQNEPDVTLESEHLVFSRRPATQLPPPDGGRCDASGLGDRGRGSCEAGWCSTYDGLCHVSEHWVAELTYELRNVGSVDRQLQVGLPFRMPDAEWEHMGPSTEDEIQGFVTFIDGNPAQVSRHDEYVYDETTEVEFNRLYVTPVSLAAGQTRTLTHRYTTYLSVGTADAINEFSYLLRTGLGWAGLIGDVRIDLELPPDANPCLLATLPYTRDGQWLRVHLTSWVPKRDFRVLWVSRAALLDTENPGFLPDDEQIESICDDALAQPVEARRLFADHLELFYGAPDDGTRTTARTEGPARWCNAHYQISHELSQPGWATPLGDDAQQLSYTADSSFPGNMPDAVRECVARLRAAE